jgi:hypothetical protein
MSDKDPENKLTPINPQSLSIRASLISRGLKDVSENENTSMYSWLDSLPEGSSILSLGFEDGVESPSDNRNVSYIGKHISEMSKEEQFLAITEETCTGLLSVWAFDVDAKENKYPCSGYIEIEGIHPFKRSQKLVKEDTREKLMSAVGITIRNILDSTHDSIRIYCSGSALLRFHTSNLTEIRSFVEQVNSTLGTLIVNIKKPDGTIVKRKSELYLEITEYREQGKNSILTRQNT